MTAPDAPKLLSADEVIAIHDAHLAIFGGDPGVLSLDRLEAAVHAPAMVWLYEPAADLFDLAAAYAFHLCQDHPFVDGNKRTAFLATLVFLQINGVEVPDRAEAVVCELVLTLANGMATRPSAAVLLRRSLAI